MNQQKDEEECIPVKNRTARPYDSSQYFKVSEIKYPPKSFGIPTHLSEYDSLSPYVHLESNHKVKVNIGQVYKVTL